jgi:hypothetical protein
MRMLRVGRKPLGVDAMTSRAPARSISFAAMPDASSAAKATKLATKSGMKI